MASSQRILTVAQAPTVAPAPRRLLHEVFLLLVPLLLPVLVWPFFRDTDPDYWWHVRAGQLIWESRALPSADSFSHTALGRPWVMHEWLTEILFFLVESGVGYWASVMLFGLAGVASSLLVYLACRRWGLGEVPSALLMMWAYALLGLSSNVRPQTLTALFVALQTYWITAFKRDRSRKIWLLPLVYVLWVNMHGGYVIGLALLGLALMGESVSAWLGRSAAPLLPLLQLTLLCLLATLVNPYGLAALLYPFSYAGTGNASMRYINEWQSPDFHLAGLAPLALAITALLALGTFRRPVGITETLWTLLLGVMSLLSVRHVQLFGIVAVPLIGARAQAEVPALRRELAEWHKPGILVVLWPVMVLMALALVMSPRDTPLTLQMGRSPSADGYPAGAVAYIREHRPAGRILNHYGWGGYLVYELYGDYPVFIDGRADVYGDEHMDRYMDIVRLRPTWRDTMQAYGVGLVLVQKNSPLAVVLVDDPRWDLVYEGPVEVLYVLSEA